MKLVFKTLNIRKEELKRSVRKLLKVMDMFFYPDCCDGFTCVYIF